MNSCVCSQAARAARARADCLAHDFAYCARAENVAAARFLEVARVGRACYVLHEIPLLQRRSLVLVVTHRPPTVCSMHTAKVRATLHARRQRCCHGPGAQVPGPTYRPWWPGSGWPRCRTSTTRMPATTHKGTVPISRAAHIPLLRRAAYLVTIVRCLPQERRASVLQPVGSNSERVGAVAAVPAHPPTCYTTPRAQISPHTSPHTATHELRTP